MSRKINPSTHVNVNKIGRTLMVTASYVPNGGFNATRVSIQKMDAIARKHGAYRFNTAMESSEGGNFGLGSYARSYILRKI